MNQKRADISDSSTFIAPGQINALGLIDEIFHLVVSEYYKKMEPTFAMRFTPIWKNPLANPDCKQPWNPLISTSPPFQSTPENKVLLITCHSVLMACQIQKLQWKNC